MKVSRTLWLWIPAPNYFNSQSDQPGQLQSLSTKPPKMLSYLRASLSSLLKSDGHGGTRSTMSASNSAHRSDRSTNKCLVHHKVSQNRQDAAKYILWTFGILDGKKLGGTHCHCFYFWGKSNARRKPREELCRMRGNLMERQSVPLPSHQLPSLVETAQLVPRTQCSCQKAIGWQA